MLTKDKKEFWRGFLAAEPRFAGDGIGSAVDGPDPPDVLCATLSGKKIGVELASWNESEQVQWRKTRKSFEDSYLRIIESANHARPDRIGWVWLHPKRRQVKPEERSQFCEELYEFLARENSLSDPEWDQPLGAAVQNFIGFPVIADYLDSVWIFPRRKLERVCSQDTIGSSLKTPARSPHPHGYWELWSTEYLRRSRTTKIAISTSGMLLTNCTWCAGTASRRSWPMSLLALQGLTLPHSH